MTAQYPQVIMNLVENPVTSRPGMAGKVAIVGAFNSEATNPILVTNLTEAYEKLGSDTSFKGCACLDDLFYGASSVLAVNITTWTGSGEQKTADKTLSTQKLSDALAKIKGEDFDMLFVAENIEDTALVIITKFLDNSFKIKYPIGFVAGLTRADETAYETTAGLVGEHCYGIITQQLSVNGTVLSIEESGAYYTGVLAGLNVGNSMTMKTIPNVDGVSPELTFEFNEETKAPISKGAKLMSAGLTTVKCQNRNTGNYIVVNSEQPNGLDLYINRVRDYVAKEFALHQFLGERSNEASLNGIKQEIERVKDKCVNTLDLLEDIVYSVQKRSASCVDIYIDSLLFAGIITEIEVYIKVEVE